MIKPLTKNAKKPKGLWGRLMIRKMDRGHLSLTLWAIEKMHLRSNSTILDIGCGGGNAVKLMLEKVDNGKVCGVDYSDLSVKKSQKKNKRAIKQNRAEIKQGSVSSLPYNENSFDFITAFETIYFWPSPKQDFDEVYRVTIPGGKFCVVCEMVKNEDGTGAHTDVAEFLSLHYFTQSEIESLFINSGFKLKSTHTTENNWLCVIGQK